MHRILRAIAAMAVIAPIPAAHASTVVLWPVDPAIAADQRSTALWIENRGTEPVSMQVRVLGWTQARGEDDYLQQQAVVSSPPVAQIAPGARQLVRLIRRAPDSAGEHAYRLLIDELPKPANAATGAASASLAVQMRYSIPLFTYGPGEERAAALTGRLVIDRGERFVELRNTGARHARLTDLRLRTNGTNASLAPGLLGYVLPGAKRRFKIPLSAPVTGEVVVSVNGADHTASPTT